MAAERRTAAVVGANGFLGDALVRAFAETPTQVTPFTRSVPFSDESGRLAADVTTADTVFWLASSIRPATAETDSAAAAADRRALTTLLDGLQAADPERFPRIVVVSSGGTVYDPNSPSPHHEDSPLRPANHYGEAMLAIEELVRERAPDTVVLRVANAYGPGQPVRRGQGVIAYWFAAVQAGEPVHVLGSDEVARDYVYIDDVAAALVAVHQAAAPPPVMNIGSGVPTSLRELLRLVVETVAPADVVVNRDPGRAFDAPSTWLDVSLAGSVLGWQPRVTLRDGLAATWARVSRTDEATGPAVR